MNLAQDRKCPHCGGAPAPEAKAAPPARDARLDLAPLELSQEAAAQIRRRRRLPLLTKVLLAWSILMALIFGAIHWSKQGRESRASTERSQAALRQPAEPPSEGERFIQEVLPQCRETLAAYLNTTSIAQRLPLVLPHPQLEDHMERYYADNERLDADSDSLTLNATSLIQLPEGQSILTQWETPEGATFDAVFRKANHKWALDWHHFVRYSDLSWPQFVAGAGDDVAEFRLHARRRLASDGDPHNGIGVVLSAPLRRHMEEVGFSQSMPGLSMADDGARLLDQAFNLLQEGTPILGGTIRDLNPQGMIRVRVRVQRIGADGGYQFRIIDVPACHWYGSEATGLEQTESTDQD